MTTRFIGVRDVDEETFLEFKAFAVKHRFTLSEAVTLAIRLLLHEWDCESDDECFILSKSKPHS